jgi:type I restriction enzyme S subunit
VNSYSEMKDSGVWYIKEIPKHWCIKKGKNLYQIDTGKLDVNAEDIDGIYPFFTCSMQPKRINTYAFDCEALLVAGNGMVGYTQYYNGKFDAYQRTYVLHNFQNILAGYLKYYVENELITEISPNTIGSVIDFIKLGDLQNFHVVYPPVDEQESIVYYLDNKIGNIDLLVTDLKKQLQVLENYRREIIANAIIKGIQKNVPMKDSGVDWMGEVPKHWDVTKMKWMFEIVKRIYGAEDRDVLSITQRGIKIKDIDSNDGQLAESYANYQMVNVNDFAMNSMDLLTGWVDCSPYEGVTSPDYRVFRFQSDKPQCHGYYKYLFQMCYTNRIFYRLGQGVSNLGRWRLQADQFLNIRLPQPPIEEQEQIAAYLDTKVGQIEELTADIKAQIEKLKEYRKIVIHDAVTGKIKVTEDK